MKRGCALALSASLGCCRVLAQAEEKIPELLPPQPELPATFWELHGWQCVLGAAAFIVIVIVGIVWLRRPRAMVIEPPDVQARHALEKLRGQKEDGALVMNVSRILKRYVIAALKLPAAELTTTEFRRALQEQPQVAPELAATTGDFLRRCDEWKFAPEHPVEKLGAVEGALEIVEKLEASRQPAVNPKAVA
jgi:hypothetical protein